MSNDGKMLGGRRRDHGRRRVPFIPPPLKPWPSPFRNSQESCHTVFYGLGRKVAGGNLGDGKR